MHAESTAFLCCDSAEFFGILQIPRGAKCHRVRKDRSSKEMGWKDASFKIPSDQQGKIRLLLEFIEQCNRFESSASRGCTSFCWHRHRQRPDMVFANIVAEFQIAGTACFYPIHAQAKHEQLPHLFLD